MNNKVSAFYDAYALASRYAPISAINSYYVFKWREAPRRWIDSPFFFIHVPKAAGTSVCAALDMPKSGHVLFDEMARDVSHVLASKPCMMIVREPVDRLISTYYYSRRLRRAGVSNLVERIAAFDSLEAFLLGVSSSENLRKHYFLRPAVQFYRSAIRFGADVHVLKFDDASETATNYFRSFGINLKEFPRENSRHENSRCGDKISSELVEMVRTAYKADLDLMK